MTACGTHWAEPGRCPGRRGSEAEPDGGADGADGLIEVRNLGIEFARGDGWVRVVEGVDLSLPAGRTLALVGESGCGKTVTALALMGLLPRRTGRIASGSIRLDGRELVDLPPGAMRAIRGREMAMIFQEPDTSLNPAFTVGDQIAEMVRVHQGLGRRAAMLAAVEALERVDIPDPGARARSYPHELSGGMRQRAMIAMALACEPRVLLADEPTTALDVTIQAQILDLLASLRDELGMAMVFVTHDLGVVAEIADDVAVMYAGQIVERATVDELFAHPKHPYTEALIRALPQSATPGERLATIPGQVPDPAAWPRGCHFADRCAHAQDRCRTAPVELVDGVRCVRAAELHLAGTDVTTETLLSVRGLEKHFPVRSGVLRRVIGHVRAVDGVDLEIQAGQTLGLVGESGSGKSTTARLVTRLIEPTGGQVVFAGADLAALSGAELRTARRRIQMVFQDPYASLSPRFTVAQIVSEPLQVHKLEGGDLTTRVVELLDQVGLDASVVDRYPHEFSGGQRQRIAVARALALRPDLVVCDEPVSALDVSVQSQVINLLADLQAEQGLAYLFISHDLSVVRHVSDRIAVMYLGRVVEEGPAAAVHDAPTHPYTEALVSAVPVPNPTRQRARRRIVLQGDVPSPLHPPAGCHFHPRCPHVLDICRTVDPPAFTLPDGGRVHCHLHTEGPRLAGAPVRALEAINNGR